MLKDTRAHGAQGEIPPLQGDDSPDSETNALCQPRRAKEDTDVSIKRLLELSNSNVSSVAWKQSHTNIQDNKCLQR